MLKKQLSLEDSTKFSCKVWEVWQNIYSEESFANHDSSEDASPWPLEVGLIVYNAYLFDKGYLPIPTNKLSK